jgi:hypothetical protein
MVSSIEIFQFASLFSCMCTTCPAHLILIISVIGLNLIYVSVGSNKNMNSASFASHEVMWVAQIYGLHI